MPFQIACGSCFMCEKDLQTQCETTQVTSHGMGAALFGYTDPLGLNDFITRRLPLSQAPEAYAMFQSKEDEVLKVVFEP